MPRPIAWGCCITRITSCISSRAGPSCCTFAGIAYKDLEDQGYLLVLTKVQVRYRSPARYDDLLTLRTTVVRTTLVKIEHRYELLRDGLMLAEGETTLGCVDREGKVQQLPKFLQGEA